VGVALFLMSEVPLYDARASKQLQGEMQGERGREAETERRKDVETERRRKGEGNGGASQDRY
jgi:hypothetical protein